MSATFRTATLTNQYTASRNITCKAQASVILKHLSLWWVRASPTYKKHSWLKNYSLEVISTTERSGEHTWRERKTSLFIHPDSHLQALFWAFCQLSKTSTISSVASRNILHRDRCPFPSATWTLRPMLVVRKRTKVSWWKAISMQSAVCCTQISTTIK